MPDNENVHRTELPKIVDDGTNNNYGEWRTKSYHKLREWDLWKYIEGPTSIPPEIPPLRQPIEYHGLNDENELATVRVPGNVIEHDNAVRAAQPWMTSNNIALSRIVAALPSHQLHLVQHTTYAKHAWEALRSVYQPRNSLRATTIKGQIMSYRCTPDLKVSTWLNDMQNLYNSLCGLDIERMTDRDFALTILDLMPQDDGWRDFVSNLRGKVRESEARNLPIDSITFITAIRDEYWYRHKDDPQSTSTIFSARTEALKRPALPKRSRPADFVATSVAPSNKRPRNPNPDKANLRCANPHCGPKVGHDTADCIAYKGAKQGQYGEWWRGPWNIHLPEPLRTKENNIPPKSHPAYSRYRTTPSINNSQTNNVSFDRSTTARIEVIDDNSQANSALTPDTNFYAWSTQFEDTVAHTSLPVLNPALPRDNACHHDSGANRHVFHDKSAFEHYQTIPPLSVKGFGQNLSAVAIGRGTVRLQGHHNNQSCSILLNNVLHIPAARTNLISGVQLDKAGVVSTLGNNSILLSANGKVIISGSVVNDMYRLNLTIIKPETHTLATRLSSSPIPQSHSSLASRISPASLASRLAPPDESPGFYTASWGT
jgi:hypothetical protein